METWVFDLIKNFFLGGAVVASISYLAAFVSPLMGAIWWAFPLSLVPSMYYMHTQGKSNKEVGQFALATTYALGILFITTFAIGKFYEKEKKSFWMPLVKGVGVYLVVGSIFYAFIKYLKLGTTFDNL